VPHPVAELPEARVRVRREVLPARSNNTTHASLSGFQSQMLPECL
jgi:hypothetical protein